MEITLTTLTLTSIQTLLSILLFISPFIIIIFFFIFHHSSSKSTSHQSTFKNYPILGTLPEFYLNRHHFLDWTTHILSNSPTNTAVFHRPGKLNGVITANPANVQHILKTNFNNYPKGPTFISLLQDFLGHGIFNSDGQKWRSQRKTASYEFNTNSLRNFVVETAANQLHTRFVPLLEAAASSNKVLDLQELLERYSFDNICKVAFNYDPCCLTGDGTYGSEFMQAFEEAATLSSGRFMYIFPGVYKIKKFFNFGSEFKLAKAIDTVHKFADNIIKTRLNEISHVTDDETDKDLLSRFMNMSDYSLEMLRDIVISFILAGRDTTSSGLTWFFWVLSKHPEVERKIFEEVKKIRGVYSGEGCYSFDELREMHYLHAAISESLRLYPPVPVDTKSCRKDDVLPDGTFVGEDWFVTYHTYAMGRMKSVWGEDAGEFRPERWLEKAEEGGGMVVCRSENQYKFPVFHGGPRICLGKEMAYMQMKLVVATVVEMFEVVVVAEEERSPEHVLSLTMRMKDGLKVKVRKR
ncbi:hypothetical protein QVD17_00510 [Tagetes erecta]|uniref:Cytochrome P450 n=1 Tax=Tagetes erecta TaxID=13708 RepID=A0AAD8P0N8_TARER|nr:hypothetical protein QVD17_00510 [Tagetes erecta]